MKKRVFLACALFTLFISCKKDFARHELITQESSDVLSEGTLVYVGGMRDGYVDSGKLCAIDAISGALVWKYSVAGGYFTSTPCIGNGVLYAQTNFPEISLSALDAHTGILLWRKVYAGPNDFSTDIAPCYQDNVVYMTCGNNLLAIDAASGNVKWRYKTRATGLNRFSSPVAMYNNIYINDKSAMYSINAQTGIVNWQIPADLPYRTAPAVKNSLLFFNSMEGSVAVDTSGTTKWTNPETGYALFAAALNKKSLFSISYFFEAGATVHALHANDGSVSWSHAISQVPRGDLFAGGDALYINLQDSIEALDIITGNRKWILYTGTTGESTSFSSPVSSASMVYTYGKDDSLYAINRKTGKKVWSHFVNGGVPPSSSPVVLTAEGEAVYPTSSGMRQ